MLIAIDIGNSSINIGFFNKTDVFVHSIETHPLRTEKEYFSIIRGFLAENSVEKNPSGVIISSVVPGHTGVLREALKMLMPVEPLIVSSSIKTGIKFKIPEPEKIGSDRIANSVAAYEIFKRAVAAVDFGTASTISVVDNNANYIGGSILPGIRLMSESLEKGTSQLPKVQVKSSVPALGKNTISSIQSGLLYGTAGAIEKLLSNIETEIGCRLKVVVTGGYGGLISKHLKRRHIFIRYLTLEGLKLIYKRNINA